MKQEELKVEYLPDYKSQQRQLPNSGLGLSLCIRLEKARAHLYDIKAEGETSNRVGQTVYDFVMWQIHLSQTNKNSYAAPTHNLKK